MPSIRRRIGASHLTVPAALAAAALLLSGCAASGAEASPHEEGGIRVVASTNVWGDIAKSVGGDHVSVTSIIDDPAKDPHDYQADARNQLALSKAQLVIENGGGYDDFVGSMLRATKSSSRVVLNAVDISGKATSRSDVNEHIWYDLPSVDAVIGRLASSYAKLDPSHRADYAASADALTAKIGTLITKEAGIKAAHGGAPVSITEPVPLYLLDACGLVNKTPEKFSAAIEDGTDAAPNVLRSTLALYQTHQVKLLAYNEQTSGAQTAAVLKAAKAADIPAVPVAETLPRGTSYVRWMSDTLDDVSTALEEAR